MKKEVWVILLILLSTSAYAVSCGDDITFYTILDSDLLNCPNNGLNIKAFGATLDCAGHWIIGTGTDDTKYAINISKYNATTIKNCQIEIFNKGVYIEKGNNNTLLNNKIYITKGAIYIQNGSENKAINNTLNSNYDDAIVLSYGSKNIIKNNSITYTSGGNSIRLYKSNSNQVEDSFMQYALNEVVLIDQSSNNLFLNNSVNVSASGFYLKSNSNNNTFTGNSAYDGGEGFWVVSGSNNRFINNTLDDANVRSSSSKNVFHNNVVSNTTWGFRIDAGSNNVTNNIVYGSEYGFYINGFGVLDNNAAYNNTYGFFLKSNVKVTNNIAYNNTYGFELDQFPVDIINSTAYNNKFGINLIVVGNKNNIKGGVFKDSVYADYLLNYFDIYKENIFRNTNFTDQRKIRFNRTGNYFKYNDNDGSIWLNTTPSKRLTLTRSISSWNSDSISFDDKANETAKLNYNFTGLEQNTFYKVYNNSDLLYNLTSSEDGNIGFSVNYTASVNQKIEINSSTRYEDIQEADIKKEVSYNADADTFSVQFLMFYAPGVDADLHVYEDNVHVGYNKAINSNEIGFPAEYSGKYSNPEIITIPYAANRTFKVIAELANTNSNISNYITMYALKTPFRDAVMLAAPVTINKTINKSVNEVKNTDISILIGEESCQKPLHNVTINISNLTYNQSSLSIITPKQRTINVLPACTSQGVDFEISATGYHAAGTYKGTITIDSDETASQSVDVGVKILSYSQEPQSTIEFRTATLDFDAVGFTYISSTMTVDGTTKQGVVPPYYKAVFNVPTNTLIQTDYSAVNYKPDTDYVYFDENLVNCIKGSSCNLDSNGYNTNCEWTSYDDFECTVTKDSFKSIYVYNVDQMAVKRANFLQVK